MKTRLRVESTSSALGALAATSFVAGPIGIQLGLLSPWVGFLIFVFGLLVGSVGLAAGMIGVWRTRATTGRSGRGHALTGIGIGLALIGIVLVGAGPERGAPPINDITTDRDNPPPFVHAATLTANLGRNLSYPGDHFAQQQRDAYPDLHPIRIPTTSSRAFRSAEAVAESLGWEITYSDEQTGVIEATDSSRIFRFIDDIVIRIRPALGVAVVDLRSRSRIGKGDLGANAARIRAFRAALDGSMRSDAG
jgi:uncharacterized protein (DUF1499 family)